MYLNAGQDNIQIYLETHEAEGAANEGEHHDGDDLLAGQAGPRDHLSCQFKKDQITEIVISPILFPRSPTLSHPPPGCRTLGNESLSFSRHQSRT